MPRDLMDTTEDDLDRQDLASALEKVDTTVMDIRKEFAACGRKAKVRLSLTFGELTALRMFGMKFHND